MRQIVIAAFLSLAALSPAAGGEGTPEEDGSSLMDRGARLFLRGLMQEMRPAVKDLQGLVQEMGPAMLKLRALIGDFNKYHAPEMLPNGDIIIRRKTPAELALPKGGEVEI